MKFESAGGSSVSLEVPRFVELTVPLRAVQTAADEWSNELVRFPVRR